MTSDSLVRLLQFLDRLDVADIAYRIERQDPEALMVTFSRPGKRVEVSFSLDDVTYSVFAGDDQFSGDMTALKEFISSRWHD